MGRSEHDDSALNLGPAGEPPYWLKREIERLDDRIDQLARGTDKELSRLGLGLHRVRNVVNATRLRIAVSHARIGVWAVIGATILTLLATKLIDHLWK